MIMNKVFNRIESITGNVITVRAEGVRYHELAQINTRFGKSLAEVNKIDGDIVSLQVFAGGQGISTGDEVRFLGHEMRVSFSEDLLGRIFNGSGEPRDKGPVLTENLKPIGGPSVNPTKRILANRMMRTNIPMIDMFNTLVVSQSFPFSRFQVSLIISFLHELLFRQKQTLSCSAVWVLNTTISFILKKSFQTAAHLAKPLCLSIRHPTPRLNA